MTEMGNRYWEYLDAKRRTQEVLDLGLSEGVVNSYPAVGRVY